MEVLPAQDLATVHEKEKDGGEAGRDMPPMRGHLAGVAALAAQRKNMESEGGAGGRETLMRAPPRRGVSRHHSSSTPMGRKPQLARAQSMRIVRPLHGGDHKPGQPPPPGTRKVMRSNSALQRSDQSSMMSRSVGRARSSRGLPAQDGPLTRQIARQDSAARPVPGGRSLIRHDSARALPSRRHVSRTNSQRSLAHMHQVERTLSTDSALRPYRGREQLVNQSIQRMDSGTGVLRQPDDRSCSDMSSFTIGTMDSVNLRKAQIIAEPVDDDRTYREEASFADHDSISMMSGDFPDYTEFLPEYTTGPPYDGASVAGTFCTLDSVQLRQDQIHEEERGPGYDNASISTIETGEMLVFEADQEFDEYSCLDEYSRSARVVEGDEELPEEDSDDDDDDDEEVIDEESQSGEIVLEEDTSNHEDEEQ